MSIANRMCRRNGSGTITKTFASDDAVPWVSVNLGEGAKNPITAEVKCVRVFERRAGPPGRESWLYIRRFADGKIKTPVLTLSQARMLVAVVAASRVETIEDAIAFVEYRLRRNHVAWMSHRKRKLEGLKALGLNP